MERRLAIGSVLPMALGALVLAHGAQAQCPDAWTLVATSGPPAGETPSMVFDTAHAVCVLFVDGQTWEWNGLAWALVSTSGPAPRTGQSLVYDPIRSRVVLFGGKDATTVFGDTWEWDGTSWTLASSSGAPPRWAHAIAFHAPTSRCVMYGGIDTNGVTLGDTWDWDGMSWSVHSTLTSPGPRAFHSMCRTTGSGRAIIFGGTDGGDSNGEIWRLNTTSWSPLFPCALLSRRETAMSYDSLHQRVVLFGGFDHDDGFDGTTYESIGGAPAPKTLTGPSGRRSTTMAYDSFRDRTVLFGGVTAAGPSAETWEYRPVTVPSAPANFTAFEVRKGVVSVAWTDGVAAGSGARVERDRWSGAIWSNVATVASQSPSSGRLFDLPGSGAFRYRVQATSCTVSSPWSANLVVLPTAPNGVVATRAGSSANVRWTDNSDFESNFEVQRERRVGASWLQTTTVAKPPANVLSIQDPIPHGQWRYRVRAQNVGGSSPWSAWAAITL